MPISKTQAAPIVTGFDDIFSSGKAPPLFSFMFVDTLCARVYIKCSSIHVFIRGSDARTAVCSFEIYWIFRTLIRW